MRSSFLGAIAAGHGAPRPTARLQAVLRRIMQTMADITVTPIGTRKFHVQISDGALETTHHVTVPESLINELQLPEDTLDSVVRESFVFLLEREPASSIMRVFSLDVISGYFPEYKEKLSERL
jgi:hypothetical protein